MEAIAPSFTPEPQHDISRFVLILAAAGLVHAFIIFGIGFDLPKPAKRAAPPALAITLVHHRSEPPKEEAKVLAQASQSGGGEQSKEVRNTAPASTAKQLPQRGQTPKPTPPKVPEAKPKPVKTVVRTQAPTPKKAPEPKVQAEEQPQPRTQPNARELISRSLEMALLSAEIDLDMKSYAQQPRHKHISSATQEYKYAAYMEAWRYKVERIGNLNYPEEAKQNSLSGALRLDVALNPDGSLHKVEVRKSSGDKVLDQAAIKIVELAAPFAPFPKNFRDDIDILHINRTWFFGADNRLFSR